ncbi:hypothetical protein YC2023_014619 [Brassica napus]
MPPKKKRRNALRSSTKMARLQGAAKPPVSVKSLKKQSPLVVTPVVDVATATEVVLTGESSTSSPREISSQDASLATAIDRPSTPIQKDREEVDTPAACEEEGARRPTSEVQAPIQTAIAIPTTATAAAPQSEGVPPPRRRSMSPKATREKSNKSPKEGRASHHDKFPKHKPQSSNRASVVGDGVLASTQEGKKTIPNVEIAQKVAPNVRDDACSDKPEAPNEEVLARPCIEDSSLERASSEETVVEQPYTSLRDDDPSAGRHGRSEVASYT